MTEKLRGNIPNKVRNHYLSRRWRRHAWCLVCTLVYRTSGYDRAQTGKLPAGDLDKVAEMAAGIAVGAGTAAGTAADTAADTVVGTADMGCFEPSEVVD